MNRIANYVIDLSETTLDTLVLRDLGPWDVFPTVTNTAEAVVEELHRDGILQGRRLLYYDSLGDLAELVHRDGRFVGFLYAGGRKQ